MPRVKYTHSDELKIVDWMIENDVDFYVMVDEYGLYEAIKKIFIKIKVKEHRKKFPLLSRTSK